MDMIVIFVVMTILLILWLVCIRELIIAKKRIWFFAGAIVGVVVSMMYWQYLDYAFSLIWITWVTPALSTAYLYHIIVEPHANNPPELLIYFLASVVPYCSLVIGIFINRSRQSIAYGVICSNIIIVSSLFYLQVCKFDYGSICSLIQ